MCGDGTCDKKTVEERLRRETRDGAVLPIRLRIGTYSEEEEVDEEEETGEIAVDEEEEDADDEGAAVVCDVTSARRVGY